MPKIPLLLITIIHSFFCSAQENISITYTGNMGVHISGSRFSVLIDGLHTKYGDDYLFPSPELVTAITTKLRPDAILFTHHHGDHFNAKLAEDYLKNNTNTVLLGPQQITKNFTGIKNRLFTIATKNYAKQIFTIGKTQITGLKINHAGKRHIKVENIGYIVTIDHKKLLHVGDTNWLEDIDLFNQLELLNEAIDIAILPYWMLIQEDALQLIKKYINPKHLIATHISPKIKKQELLKLKSRYPNVHFFTKLEQQIQL